MSTAVLGKKVPEAVKELQVRIYEFINDIGFPIRTHHNDKLYDMIDFSTTHAATLRRADSLSSILSCISTPSCERDY